MIIGIIFVFLFMFLEISLIMTAIISQDWRYGFVALFMITLVIEHNKPPKVIETEKVVEKVVEKPVYKYIKR